MEFSGQRDRDSAAVVCSSGMKMQPTPSMRMNGAVQLGGNLSGKWWLKLLRK